MMQTPTDSHLTQEDLLSKQLKSLLKNFTAASADIEASAVISGDGFTLASVLNGQTDPDRFGAMCASLLALANRAAQETARGRLKQVLIEGQEGSMLLVNAGSNAVLVVAAKPSAKIGKVFIDVRKVALKVAGLV